MLLLALLNHHTQRLQTKLPEQPNMPFITLKDHKPNFRNNPTCRLINPTKPEIGKISKQILEKINTDVKTATKLNQWKNTDEVIT